MKHMQTEKFPAAFLWGASTSAFQCEGAALEDGKGLSVADTRPVPAGLSDSSIAADHYHHYKEDVALMKELGLKCYRFSIAWTRIYPNGDDETPNEKGIAFYSSLIDELLAAGIEPIATLYHFDLPDSLEKRFGGWTGRETIDAYERYVTTCFEQFGDRVKKWISINEQMMMVLQSAIYFKKDMALKTQAACCLNMSLAEKKAFQACHRIIPGGMIGPSSAFQVMYPLTCASEDVEAAMDAEDFLSWMVLDLSVRGEFPSSTAAWLRLHNAYPEISAEDEALLKSDTPDFIGVNYYASVTARKAGTPDPKADLFFFNSDDGWTIVNNPIIKTTTWLRGSYDPRGLTLTLRRINDRYRLPVLITENGYPQTEEPVNGEINDDARIEYIRDHLNAVRDAIGQGVDIIGYNIWSFMDLLSGNQGYRKRYGLVYIDHQDGNTGTLARLRKKSFFWYQNVIRTNGEEM